MANSQIIFNSRAIVISETNLKRRYGDESFLFQILTATASTIPLQEFKYL